MKKSQAANTFNEGLIMDLNPVITPNTVLTNCLNGTLVTFNGNENALQNDMGNGRVETAYLPEGYIPLGTAELGGIIYIVSYNPLTNKSQIGCFPSPERNITSDELVEPKETLVFGDLWDGDDYLKSKYKKLILLDKVLHPGDKFQIGSANDDFKKEGGSFLSAKVEGNTNPDLFPKYLKLNIVAVQDDGTISNLNNSLTWFDNNYYIYPNNFSLDEKTNKLDLDEYRNFVTSNYNVFDSKVDGKLAILAELECIDNFSVSWDAYRKNKTDPWNIYLYTNWTYNNSVNANKINLYGVRVIEKVASGKDNDGNIEYTNKKETEITIEKYPKSTYGTTNDAMADDPATVYYIPMYYNDVTQEPDYKTNNGIKTPRKNDGSDNQYLLDSFVKLNTTSGYVTLDIYPAMPFGYLQWQKQSITINIDDLGSGKIGLREYRYYYNENGTITLNWGLDAYPERNKSINSVEFQFYEYTHANILQEFITSNADYIQNGFSRNGIWYKNEDLSDESGLSDTFETSILDAESTIPFTGKSVKLIYTKTIANKSSYSGNFQEVINDLDSDKLYFVRIMIDYSGEKTYYYRFLYSFEIFNKYFFTESDFKNIKLQDCLEEKYYCETIDKQKSNVNKIEYLEDSSNNKVDIIPEYLETSTTGIKYNIKQECKHDIQREFEVKTPYNGLMVGIENIEENNFSSQFSTQNAKQVSMSSDNIVGSSSKLESIGEYSTQDIMYSIKKNTPTLGGGVSSTYTPYLSYYNNFSSIITVPYMLDYTKYQSVPVQYKLTPLDIRCAWLLFDGLSKEHDLYLNEYYDEGIAGDDKKDNKKKVLAYDEFNTSQDDKNHYGEIVQYTNVYNYIKSELQNCDIFAVKWRTHDHAKSGDEGAWTIWGSGDYNEKDRKKVTYTNRVSFAVKQKGKNTSEDPTQYCLAYFMLDKNDNLCIFTFEKPKALNSEWYGKIAQAGKSYSEWNDVNTNWNINAPFAINYDSSSDDMDVLRGPFTKYYKVTNANDTKNEYQWSTVYYYENFKWVKIYENEVILNIQLVVNNNKNLISNNIIPNIYYTSKNTVKFTDTIQNYIDTEDYLKLILNSSSEDSLIMLADDESTIVRLKIKPTLLYDSAGNEIEYLKIDTGNSNTKLTDLHSSYNKIKCNDSGNIRVTVGKNNTIVAMLMREEEQSLSITNVIMLSQNERYN